MLRLRYSDPARDSEYKTLEHKTLEHTPRDQAGRPTAGSNQRTGRRKVQGEIAAAVRSSRECERRRRDRLLPWRTFALRSVTREAEAQHDPGRAISPSRR